MPPKGHRMAHKRAKRQGLVLFVILSAKSILELFMARGVNSVYPGQRTHWAAFAPDAREYGRWSRGGFLPCADRLRQRLEDALYSSRSYRIGQHPAGRTQRAPGSFPV
jgi:hypothetical protein